MWNVLLHSWAWLRCRFMCLFFYFKSVRVCVWLEFFSMKHLRDTCCVLFKTGTWHFLHRFFFLFFLSVRHLSHASRFSPGEDNKESFQHDLHQPLTKMCLITLKHFRAILFGASSTDNGPEGCRSELRVGSSASEARAACGRFWKIPIGPTFASWTPPYSGTNLTFVLSLIWSRLAASTLSGGGQTGTVHWSIRVSWRSHPKFSRRSISLDGLA